VETTVCPARLVNGPEYREANEALDWFLWSCERDSLSGTPTSIHTWPLPGGVLRQPAKLVDVASFLLNEWGRLPKAKSEDADSR